MYFYNFYFSMKNFKLLIFFLLKKITLIIWLVNTEKNIENQED